MSQSLRCDSTQIDFNENSLESSIFFYAYNTFNPTNWNVINNNFIIEAMRFVHFVWLIRWIIDNYLRILEILRKSAVRMLYKLKCNRRHFQWFRWSKSIKIGQFQQINRCLVYIHRIEMKIIDNNNWSMMLPIIIDKSPSIYLPNKSKVKCGFLGLAQSKIDKWFSEDFSICAHFDHFYCFQSE